MNTESVTFKQRPEAGETVNHACGTVSTGNSDNRGLEAREGLGSQETVPTPEILIQEAPGHG